MTKTILYSADRPPVRFTYPIVRIAVCALLAAALLAGPLLPRMALGLDAGQGGAAAAAEQQVIRVGFPQQPGLSEVAQDGTYTGYTYEYLEQVSQYTGWRYEYVTIEGDLNEQLVTLLDMLAAGEIDLLGAMSYSESLADIYDYSVKPYGNGHTALFVEDGNNVITDTSIYRLDHLRAATNGPAPVSTAELQAFCEMNGIELETVVCDGEEGLLAAIEAGEADVVLGVDLAPIEGMHVVTTFKQKPFYFAMPKGSDEVAAQLNEAIASLENADPQLQSELYAKYIDGGSGTSGLSAEMLDYIEQKGTIRVGYAPGAAPIQDTDDATGEMRGASKGVLEYVSEYTGLSVETVEMPVGMEPGRAIDELGLDMVAGVAHDFEYAREGGFLLGTPYLKSLSWHIVNKAIATSDLSGKRLAVTKDRAAAYRDADNVIVFDTMKECIDAIEAGTADYAYTDGYTAPYYIASEEYRNITAILDSSISNSVSFAFPVSSDPMLLKIVNKAIENMPTGVINTSLYGEVSQTQKMTVEQFIRDYAVEIVLIGLLLAAVIIALAVLYARARAKAMSVVEAEKDRLEIRVEQDDLTGLLAVGAFREKAGALAKSGQAGAFFIVDIDDFKSVNDTRGHREGDEALISLAAALRATFRSDDVVGRLGGDEFAACVRGPLSGEDIELLCTRLLGHVADAASALGYELGASVGATAVCGSERYIDLYDRADRAMYQAKRNGKHGFAIG